jgi:antitoxin HicB
MARLEYPVIIEPLPEDEGGGFVALVPDLSGCMSDGETAEAAVSTVKDAIAQWIDEARRLGRPVPGHRATSRRLNRAPDGAGPAQDPEVLGKYVKRTMRQVASGTRKRHAARTNRDDLSG